MTKERLEELLKVTGPIIPEAMDECVGDLETAETELLPGETLRRVLSWWSWRISWQRTRCGD